MKDAQIWGLAALTPHNSPAPHLGLGSTHGPGPLMAPLGWQNLYSSLGDQAGF